MITTNQTKQFCNSNQYWLFYRTDYESISKRYDKLLRYPTVTYQDKYQYDLATWWHNSLYFYAHKEFKRKFHGIKQHYIYHFDFITWVQTIKYIVIISMNKNGSWTASIYSASIEKDDDVWFCQKLPFIGEDNHRFIYDGIINEQSITDACKKEINKFLFPHGSYRNCQEYWLTSKKETLKEYRRLFKTKFDYEYCFEYEDELQAWIKRNFNIDVTHIDILDAIELVNKVGKQDKLMIARAFDWSFMEYFDGDVDEAEELFWEEMNNYEPNTLLL